jgi:hypothetical protein
MYWNIFMHILIGLLGTQHFTVTPKGILLTIFIVTLTQCAELIRYYRDEKKKIESETVRKQGAKMEEFKKGLPKVLPALFVQNLTMYSVIVLFSAVVGRSSGYGL